jgi:DNA-binding transcriptional MerR regulator
MFADLTRLSIKALRLYDQLGILAPLHIDPQTGYRYYGVEQLSSARMIRTMRDMDMPLATIRRMLAVIPSLRRRPNCLCSNIWRRARDNLKRSAGWLVNLPNN